MKLNFYFEFPTPDVDVKDIFYHNDTTHLISSAELYRLYKNIYPEIEFKAINSRELDWHGNIGQKLSCPACKYGHHFLIIENPDNKKYFIISYWDKLRELDEYSYWDLENCVEIFAAVGIQQNDIDYQPTDIKYTPISCMSLHKTVEDKIINLFNKTKITPTNLFFRGGKYGIREYIANNDSRFTIDDTRVIPADFIEEISPYSINIDINGAAEISCRTIDIMGLKSALIRPKLSIKFHNELIPDYHYASLKCNDLGNWKDVADAYVERFEELKKDPDQVEFLATNGRRWYEENGTISAHVGLLNKLIDLNKLK